MGKACSAEIVAAIHPGTSAVRGATLELGASPCHAQQPCRRSAGNQCPDRAAERLRAAAALCQTVAAVVAEAMRRHYRVACVLRTSQGPPPRGCTEGPPAYRWQGSSCCPCSMTSATSAGAGLLSCHRCRAHRSAAALASRVLPCHQAAISSGRLASTPNRARCTSTLRARVGRQASSRRHGRIELGLSLPLEGIGVVAGQLA